MKRFLLRILTPLFDWLTKPPIVKVIPEGVSGLHPGVERRESIRRDLLTNGYKANGGDPRVWEFLQSRKVKATARVSLIDVYIVLTDRNWSTVDDICERLSRERNHVASHLSLLHKFGFVERIKQKNNLTSMRAGFCYRRLVNCNSTVLEH